MLNATLIFNAKCQLLMLNDLPPSIHNISSKLLFIKALYKYYFAQYYLIQFRCARVCVCFNEYNLKSYILENNQSCSRATISFTILAVPFKILC